jgi:phospholipase D1/2
VATRPTARQVIQTGRNVWRNADAEDAGLLVDAADYYRAFYRTAERARSHILLSGWQFNSGVELLRGDARPPGAEVRLLWFLDHLCRRQAGLRVYILAWDFHLVFALEREWMQRILFNWMTAPTFQFRFDDTTNPDGSHHQKFVVIDGVVAFVGGIDLCESRWDDRHHLEHNPLRTSQGRVSKPYHDVQAYLRGPEVAEVLTELFVERWARAAGERLRLPGAAAWTHTQRPDGMLAIGPGRVAFSRTDPAGPGLGVREVERLYTDAIAAAEHFVYIETQYFSSQRIRDALVERMRAPDRPRLDIVVLVNERAEALKEEIAVGLRQAKVLTMLRRAAAATGHRLGLYHTVCNGSHRRFRPTYVHSKVVVVDDRFLTVGSANLTNRSMGIDTELQVSWEAESLQPGLERAIRRIRVSLLAEHAGVTTRHDLRALVHGAGLVDRLESLVERGDTRLHRHGPPTAGQRAMLQFVNPDDLPFDPDESGRDEPAEEPGRRLRRALGRAVEGVWRSLDRLRSTT